MTITIQLSPDEERELQQRASLSGRDLQDYVHHLIERHIQAPGSLDALLAPVRRQFDESGMSVAELETLVEDAREEIWREKESGTAGDP